MVSQGKSFEGEAAPEQTGRLSQGPWGKGGKTLPQGVTLHRRGEERTP